MQIQSSSLLSSPLLSSPLLSSPRQTPIQNQRQGVDFTVNLISEPLLLRMQGFLQENGASPEQLNQVKQELVQLREICPDLPATAFASSSEIPTKIKIALGCFYNNSLYYDVISPLISQALETVGYTKKPHLIDSTIRQGILDVSGQIGVFADIPHDKPEEAIMILKSLNQIMKQVAGL